MQKVIDKVADAALVFILTTLIFTLIYCLVDYKYFDISFYNRILDMDYINGIYIDDLEEEKALVIEEALLLAEDLYSHYKENNGYIIYSNDIDGDVVGNFIKKHNFNVITIKDVYSKDLKGITLHELGHYLDSINGVSSNDFEFRKLYKKHLDIVYKLNNELENYEYIKSTPKEFYAEMFSNYILHKDNLKTIAPEIYGYIDKDYQEVLNYE